MTFLWLRYIMVIVGAAGRLRRDMSASKEYRDAFIERVKFARAAAGFEPADMAKILDVKLDTYRRYEGLRTNRPPTTMPNHLVTLFCTVCKVPEKWLLSGEGKGPTMPRPILSPKTRTKKAAS